MPKAPPVKILIVDDSAPFRATVKPMFEGLNFIGFPTPVGPALFFEALVAPVPELQRNGEFSAVDVGGFPLGERTGSDSAS